MSTTEAGKFKAKSKGYRYDDKFFRSLAELERYKVLKDRQRKGILSGLSCQPRFKLYEHEGDRKPYCLCIADFEYFMDNEVVVEDVKGYMQSGKPVTELYRLKRRLVRIFLGVHIREVKKTRHGWTVDGELEGVIE